MWVLFLLMCFLVVDDLLKKLDNTEYNIQCYVCEQISVNKDMHGKKLLANLILLLCSFGGNIRYSLDLRIGVRLLEILPMNFKQPFRTSIPNREKWEFIFVSRYFFKYNYLFRSYHRLLTTLLFMWCANTQIFQIYSELSASRNEIHLQV